MMPTESVGEGGLYIMESSKPGQRARLRDSSLSLYGREKREASEEAKQAKARARAMMQAARQSKCDAVGDGGCGQWVRLGLWLWRWLWRFGSGSGSGVAKKRCDSCA